MEQEPASPSSPVARPPYKLLANPLAALPPAPGLPGTLESAVTATPMALAQAGKSRLPSSSSNGQPAAARLQLASCQCCSCRQQQQRSSQRSSDRHSCCRRRC
jgi:hypothetical protein